MISGNCKKLLISAALLMGAAFFVDAQVAPRPTFDRPSNYDVQHYVLKVRFDRRLRKVFGETTVVLRPTTDQFNVFELDAVGLKFETVKLEVSDLALRFATTQDKIRITLDRNYSPSESIAVKFKYWTVPVKGVYFVDAIDEKDMINHSAQIWTQGEADEARHWFPSFDFPSDKATTEEFITAEWDETVVGNGLMIGKIDNGDGTTTWHYRMPVPHSTYLVSFVIGKYVRVDDKYGDIPLGYYVYPGTEWLAEKSFPQTKKMIPVYEELTGIKFPYNKYDQTIVAGFQFGGMENITATTLADTEVFFGQYDFGGDIVTDLVSHELAHSWFGDLVTCRNWAELWLNEGFATYMEAAYREKINGNADYMRKIKSDAREFLVDDAVTRRRHGLYNMRAAEVDKLFDVSAVTYNKGSVVLHMLRETVGTEAFWKGVNAYLTKHQFGSVTTGDLQMAMEAASGMNLKWFFDQWVYGTSAPKLTVRPIYNSKTKSLQLTVEQSQRGDSTVPMAFRLPMAVSIDIAGSSTTKEIVITKRSEVIKVALTGLPTAIKLDPNDQIPAKTVKVSAIAYR